MYLYFDKNGTLLEIINDEALRRYNKNVNDVYVYIESEQGPTEMVEGLSHLQYWFKKPTGKSTSVYSTNLQGIEPALYQIPVDFKRDVKYFKQGIYYKMYKIPLPCGNAVEDNVNDATAFEENIFETNGPVEMGIRAMWLSNSGNGLTLGKVIFTVEDAVIKTTQGISMSQFDYLIAKVEDRIKFDLVERESSLDYTMEHYVVRTFTEPMDKAKIIIPSTVDFGFVSEVNFRVWNEGAVDVEIENQSTKYPLKAIQYGFEIGNSIRVSSGQKVQILASCDGLATVVYVNVI